MKQNIAAHITLCGLITITNIALASEKNYSSDFQSLPLSLQSGRAQKKPVYNGYYTNKLNDSQSNLPIYEYHSEHAKNNVSKITYTNPETNTTNTVRFSGKNDLNEPLEYNSEKYHVIRNAQGEDIFAIKMSDGKSTESSKSSPSQSPQASLSGSQSHSPRRIETRTTLGSLASIPLSSLSNDIQQYPGFISKYDGPMCEITYTDEDGVFHTAWINHSKTAQTPTCALISNNTNEILFVVTLPKEETKDATSTTHNDDCTPENSKDSHSGSNFTAKILGTTAFVAFCIALAHRYNKLPDALTNFINQCFAQLDNLVTKSF